MKIEDLYLTESMARTLSNKVWYHNGPDFDRFDIRFIGGGEGNQVLGPGIYLLSHPLPVDPNNPYTAHQKYRYECTLSFQNGLVYSADERMTPDVANAFQMIAEELGYSSYDNLYDVRKSAMKHGRGLVGSVVAEVGNQRALQLFNKYRIYAHYEMLEVDEYEIAVFNTDIITIDSKKRIEI